MPVLTGSRFLPMWEKESWSGYCCATAGDALNERTEGTMPARDLTGGVGRAEERRSRRRGAPRSERCTASISEAPGRPQTQRAHVRAGAARGRGGDGGRREIWRTGRDQSTKIDPVAIGAVTRTSTHRPCNDVERANRPRGCAAAARHDTPTTYELPVATTAQPLLTWHSPSGLSHIRPLPRTKFQPAHNSGATFLGSANSAPAHIKGQAESTFSSYHSLHII
jgi:hypothetical protein